MAVEEEKWVSHYSSDHQILLVGEGNFSFSLSLARSFGSASNIFATSLDPYDAVIIKYSEAKSNLEKLEELGASVSHGVDATNMKNHRDLRMRKFDRVIFNFPHAGFHAKEDNPNMIMMHRRLVDGFLRNARSMLRAYGEIHVNHKTTVPYCHWNIEELACQNSLVLIKCVDFKIEDYPGYENKRGDGPRSDQPFALGECSTFKFIFSPTLHKMPKPKPHVHYSSNRRIAEQSQMRDSSQINHRVMLDHNSAVYSQFSPIRERNMNYDYVGLPQRTSPINRDEFYGIHGFNSSQKSCGVMLDHNSNQAIPRLTSFGHTRERDMNYDYVGLPQRTSPINRDEFYGRHGSNSSQKSHGVMLDHNSNQAIPRLTSFGYIRERDMNYDYVGLPQRTSPINRDEFYGIHGFNSSNTSRGVMLDHNSNQAIPRLTSFGHIRERHMNYDYVGLPQRTSPINRDEFYGRHGSNRSQTSRSVILDHNSEQAFLRPTLFGPGYFQLDHIRDTNMNHYAGLSQRTRVICRDEFYGTHDLNSSQTSHGVMLDHYYEKSIWRPTSFGLFGRHD